MGITSMEGLQYAFGLQTLRLNGNRISSLIGFDFCGLTLLNVLALQDNDIRGNVDLTDLSLLRSIILTNNRITSLWLPRAPALHTVYARDNQITSITWDGEARVSPDPDDYPNLTNYNIVGNPISE